VIGLLSFNVLLMAIAFFIYMSAQTELLFLLTRGLLKGMKIGEVTHRKGAIGDKESLVAAAEQMVDHTTTLLPVRSESGQSSLVALAQIRRVPRKYWAVTRVRDVMDVVSRDLDVDDSISDRLPDLAASPVQALPVRENGVLIGYARYGDIAELLQLRSLATLEAVDDDLDKDLPRAA
jgi:hypothetical protein